MVEAFNGQVLRLFTREATNRLRDLFESSAEDEQISADKLVAFHHHDNSVNFHAPVQCSNLAFGHSTVSDSSAEYKINEELASALKALKPLLHDVLDPQRDAVTKALELLIQGATDSSITKAQAEQATKTIVAHSPSIANRLKHIAGEFALHVGANGVVAGIMWALGVSAHYTSFSTPFRPDDTSEPSRTSPWVC